MYETGTEYSFFFLSFKGIYELAYIEQSDFWVNLKRLWRTTKNEQNLTSTERFINKLILHQHLWNKISTNKKRILLKKRKK